ncbi:MAG: pyridoxamine 5'-phosphate oxidase family protein [Candidatus Poseidoniia archaeon]|nr:pyridoxamine 5'-phosphate oxidase family protein [Candidatus Poseidoniia archaeon]MDP7255527.1 pyridoxamine 5'-phosphate oxidase family protein [Candidatus Poseidoniia archaeon]MDP7473971.1 pyridoxamine 5'-phosphate oxidase family protein [Candidatus Poseidoniia archaeon]MDP7538430.1 pyridoxamine 5'-phosphate oxidase family protein [Candidatus Poseidoniia archaeon]MDP7589178.1 pyridoxamine 5'-phosphate oxidase family protein [Candidatus Poseidoniia archaeon]
MSELERTSRSQPMRHSERGSFDRETVNAILDAALLCHVGYALDGAPLVTPTLFWRDGERVFWHGSAASRALQTQAGCKVCLTVSLLDGIVLSRSAFNHSVNYRSVMLFGTARSVNDSGEKLLVLEKLMERIARGRWGEVRQPTESELKATSVLWMDIREGAAKIRAIPVGDEPADRDQSVWAGVVPIMTSLGEPEPAAGLASDIEMPDYLSKIRLS